MNGAYKEIVEKQFFDKEQSLLPQTQHLIDVMNNYERSKACMATLRHQIETEYLNESRRTELNNQQRALHWTLANLKSRIYNMKLGIFTAANASPIPVPKFIRSCVNESCNGFLNEDWFCTLCNHSTCKECNCLIKKGSPLEGSVSTTVLPLEGSVSTTLEQHTCNPDDVASAKLINTDTKPCPTCKTGIYRISGCNQMWCIQCHTAFDWTTGKIETYIHNPHYYEWMRATGKNIPRAQGDYPGGQRQQHIPMIHDADSDTYTINRDEYMTIRNEIVFVRIQKLLSHFIFFSLSYNYENYDNYSPMFESVLHADSIISHLPQLFAEIENKTPEFAIVNYRNTTHEITDEEYQQRVTFVKCLRVRLNFMNNKIDQKKFKSEIRIINKKHDWNKECYIVTCNFIITVKQLMATLYEKLYNIEHKLAHPNNGYKLVLFNKSFANSRKIGSRINIPTSDNNPIAFALLAEINEAASSFVQSIFQSVDETNKTLSSIDSMYGYKPGKNSIDKVDTTFSLIGRIHHCYTDCLCVQTNYPVFKKIHDDLYDPNNRIERSYKKIESFHFVLNYDDSNNFEKYCNKEKENYTKDRIEAQYSDRILYDERMWKDHRDYDVRLRCHQQLECIAQKEKLDIGQQKQEDPNQNQNQNQQKDPCVPNSICKCCNQLNSRSLKRLAPELFTSAELIARTATEIATSTLGTPAAPNNCECCEQTNSKYLRKLSTELLYLLNHIPVQDPHLHQTVQTLIQHQLMTIDNDNETHESKKQKTS
jgi:hypothetical protein